MCELTSMCDKNNQTPILANILSGQCYATTYAHRQILWPKTNDPISLYHTSMVCETTTKNRKNQVLIEFAKSEFIEVIKVCRK